MWHSHVHEVKSGQLIAPGIPAGRRARADEEADRHLRQDLAHLAHRPAQGASDRRSATDDGLHSRWTARSRGWLPRATSGSGSRARTNVSTGRTLPRRRLNPALMRGKGVERSRSRSRWGSITCRRAARNLQLTHRPIQWLRARQVHRPISTIGVNSPRIANAKRSNPFLRLPPDVLESCMPLRGPGYYRIPSLELRSGRLACNLPVAATDLMDC